MKARNIIIYFIIFSLGICIGYKMHNSYDVNNDFKINAQDYVLIKKYIMERNNK